MTNGAATTASPSWGTRLQKPKPNDWSAFWLWREPRKYLVRRTPEAFMAVANKKPGRAQQFFSFLLLLLPREFREHFGREMRAVFADQQQDAIHDGGLAYARFWFATVVGVFATAAREHADILVADAGYSFRVIRKDPAFLFSSVMVLGLAIGASTAGE